MNEFTYKGIKVKIDYAAYHIGPPVNTGFQAYAGNRMLDMNQEDQEEALKRRAKYRIDKFLKTGKRL